MTDTQEPTMSETWKLRNFHRLPFTYQPEVIWSQHVSITTRDYDVFDAFIVFDILEHVFPTLFARLLGLFICRAGLGSHCISPGAEAAIDRTNRSGQEQDFARISMDETWYRRVLFFAQGVESERRVIGNNATLEGNELKPDGVVERVVPIDARENIRRELDSHGRHFQCCLCFLNKVVSGADMLE